MPCYRAIASQQSHRQYVKLDFSWFFYSCFQFATISTKCFATVVMHFLCEQTKLWMHFVSNKFSPFHFPSEHLIETHILYENGRNVGKFQDLIHEIEKRRINWITNIFRHCLLSFFNMQSNKKHSVWLSYDVEKIKNNRYFWIEVFGCFNTQAHANFV